MKKTTVLNPVDIGVLMYYNFQTDDIKVGNEAVAASLIRLTRLELLEEHVDPAYKITDRGQTHVSTLCATPLPVQKWVAA